MLRVICMMITLSVCCPIRMIWLCVMVSRMGIFCKYCATLEKDLTASLEVKVEIKEKWTDENWGDMNFKQVDQFFEKTVSPVVELETNCRKRKYGPVRCSNFTSSNFTCVSVSSSSNLPGSRNFPLHLVLLHFGIKLYVPADSRKGN